MGLTFSYLVIFWREQTSRSSNQEVSQPLLDIRCTTEIASKPVKDSGIG